MRGIRNKLDVLNLFLPTKLYGLFHYFPTNALIAITWINQYIKNHRAHV